MPHRKQHLALAALFIIQYIGIISGQEYSPLAPDVQKKIADKMISLEITPKDYRISSSHYSSHNKAHFVYIQQQYLGMDIWGATANFVFGPQVTIDHSALFVPNMGDKIQLEKKRMDLSTIISNVAHHLELPWPKSKGRLTKDNDGSYVVSDLPYAAQEMVISPIWAKDDNYYKKSWLVKFRSSLGTEDYHIIVEGETGKVIEVVNRTVSCQWDTSHDHHHDHDYDYGSDYDSTSVSSSKHDIAPSSLDIGDGVYRVYAYPIESPSHGDRTLIDSPADPIASPNGWHDTDGVPGAEFTITRGNNVHAYSDISADNKSDEEEADGGTKLIFDFPFDKDGGVIENLDADQTNLFYWNNFIHDWAYKFGFNESAGNFQFNNYGRGGTDGDHVLAETLDGADTGNANFAAPEDGSSGRMQMYKWVIGGGFAVDSPGIIAGKYQSSSANFGPSFRPQVSGTIVIAEDSVEVSTDVCERIVNGDELNGHIALVDRGACDFSFKVYNAQRVGAIACIVCNNVDNGGLVSMGGGQDAEKVVIPSIFVTKEDCQLIKDQLAANQEVRVTIDETREVSSAMDNAIVAHEYGHGISLRLVGGSSTSNCLTNDEQMGEGWSDFIGLVLTQRPQDIATMKRGVGTYVLGQNNEGRGIRRYHYSTDMAINPQTHSHIRATQAPHPVGEVWVSALWDMYWLFIEQYGYDASWTDRSSGNFQAVQNVIDGMKIQPCNASLLQARDAILTADDLNYLGENKCLIWQAFARRGMGVDAIGGNANWRYDNIDGYAVPKTCEGTVKVVRSATPLVEVGEDITVRIDFQANGRSLSEIEISEVIPLLSDPGLRFGEVLTPGVSVEVDGTTLHFTFDEVTDDGLSSFLYTLRTQGLRPADFEFYEDFEGEPRFQFDRTTDRVSEWLVTGSGLEEGGRSIAVSGTIFEGEARATLLEPLQVDDNNSLLRFDNRYNTQLGFDGGIVEVSVDQGGSWTPVVESALLSGTYPDRITYDFRYTNTRGAFTGLDTLWETTIVDLSAYKGQELMIRFNYMEQDFLEIEAFEGWSIDNVEVFERSEVLGTSCLIVDDQTEACNMSTTYIGSNARTTATIEILNDSSPLAIHPNPAQDWIQIDYNNDRVEEVWLQMIAIDGRVAYRENMVSQQGRNTLVRSLEALTPGTYIVELRTPNSLRTQKFIKL